MDRSGKSGRQSKKGPCRKGHACSRKFRLSVAVRQRVRHNRMTALREDARGPGQMKEVRPGESGPRGDGA